MSAICNRCRDSGDVVGMPQKIGHWNTGAEFLSSTADAPGVIDLDPVSLARTHPAIAEEIGRGRVTSHAVRYRGPGMLVTFVVD